MSEIQPEQLLKKLEKETKRRATLRRLSDYKPYPKQLAFHYRTERERMLMAANQVGKTWCAGMELAMHVTGRYPEDWQGRQFTEANNWWAAGVTGESTRDNPQRILLGRTGEHGTGSIPKDCIVDITLARGTPDLVDNFTVRHETGDICHIAFKSYEKGREKWQGETLNGGIWFDEEPPEDIYTEGLTRTNATGGLIMMTFTPLLGMSGVVKRFLLEKPPNTSVTSMTIEDAGHYTPEQIAMIVASYPAHEREARTKGIPQLGSGKVFPVSESELRVESFAIPSHWPRINGLDFGWDHPSAGVSLAWDRDSDVLYVTNAHRARHQTPLVFAAAVKPWGDWIPWAWPHDGLQHDKGSGEQLSAQYAMAGLKMLPGRSTFEDGSSGLEAGVMELLDRMMTGRLKVFTHLADWFEEFNLYHRKDGLIVKENDDLLSATRYAVMMRREAKVKTAKRRFVDFKAGSANSWMG